MQKKNNKAHSSFERSDEIGAGVELPSRKPFTRLAEEIAVLRFQVSSLLNFWKGTSTHECKLFM
jgi:hypothetical protein